MNECLTEQVVISFIRFFLICIYIAGELYCYPNSNVSDYSRFYLKNKLIS